MASRQETSRRRYDRDSWINAALEVLAREGSQRITVRHLSEKLGVTTGSFYWHFESRDDFVNAIAGYWFERFTAQVAERAMAASSDAAQQLLELMKILATDDYSRYEVAVRAWSMQEPALAKAVAKADRYRYKAVSKLFVAIGFQDPERSMRVRTFVVFHSTDLGIGSVASKKAKLAETELRHAWFTRR